jgi:hypothetical protein
MFVAGWIIMPVTLGVFPQAVLQSALAYIFKLLLACLEILSVFNYAKCQTYESREIHKMRPMYLLFGFSNCINNLVS